MYPSVRGSTLKVHGDRLVNSPAANMMAYVAGETPVGHSNRNFGFSSCDWTCLNRASMHRIDFCLMECMSRWPRMLHALQDSGPYLTAAAV